MKRILTVVSLHCGQVEIVCTNLCISSDEDISVNRNTESLYQLIDTNNYYQKSVAVNRYTFSSSEALESGGPSSVSVTVYPFSASLSRSSSERAKSLSWRACSRSSTSAWISSGMLSESAASADSPRPRPSTWSKLRRVVRLSSSVTN